MRRRDQARNDLENVRDLVFSIEMYHLVCGFFKNASVILVLSQ
jgi:hypothetical protein